METEGLEKAIHMEHFVPPFLASTIPSSELILVDFLSHLKLEGEKLNQKAQVHD